MPRCKYQVKEEHVTCYIAVLFTAVQQSLYLDTHFVDPAHEMYQYSLKMVS
jgi:hypothetical protein